MINLTSNSDSKYSVAAPAHDMPWNRMIYSKSDVYEEEFLYDVENDLHEKYNLVDDPAFKEIRRDLAEALKRKMKEAGEKISNILPKGR